MSAALYYRPCRNRVCCWPCLNRHRSCLLTIRTATSLREDHLRIYVRQQASPTWDILWPSLSCVPSVWATWKFYSDLVLMLPPKRVSGNLMNPFVLVTGWMTRHLATVKSHGSSINKRNVAAGTFRRTRTWRVVLHVYIDICDTIVLHPFHIAERSAGINISRVTF